MTRWKATSLSSPREEPNGRIAENFGHRSDRRARSGVVRRSVVYCRAGMEGGAARPEGDWLYAALRSARDYSRRRHAAARYIGRWRSARSDSRRCLLPKLYLPHSAIDSRAWRIRPTRFRRRHAVSLDLRRDPKSLGNVENDVSTGLRSLFRCPAKLSRRDRRQLLRQ